MLALHIFVGLFISAHSVAVKNANAFKDQFCTDPRTMRKHAAYTEWADAYSCTRHRCQPGGRNLAIYTVGCKRVEAPESAIECEEVVEDTNMQFPYCCTRLRCLVVVRGEVWTRVLGQPWEVLPAAPWSHMYKMKRPPPGGEPFAPKNVEEGPVYELAEQPDPSHSKVTMKGSDDARANPDDARRASRDDVRRAHPDLVIALTTNERKNKQKRRPRAESDVEDDIAQEKPQEPFSQETFITGSGTPKPLQPEISPQMDWQNEEKKKVIEPNAEMDRDAKYHIEEEEQKKEEHGDHSPQLQTLVDAIGTRMRDIEGVVHRMNQADPDDEDSAEKRFTSRRHGTGNKYLQPVETTTDHEQPLYVEDNHLSGYYSDADNAVRRSDSDKDTVHPIYMAPIGSQSRRKLSRSNAEVSEEREIEKKHKKKSHRKKHSHKKHRKEEKRRRSKKAKSGETAEDSDGNVAVY